MPDRISGFTLTDASGKLCARAFVAEKSLIARARSLYKTSKVILVDCHLNGCFLLH